MDEHFGLNLLSLNDSVTSSASAAQELYSNSNLNSASSLSWADDEVENYATFRVQNCLEDLEEYLLTGRHPEGRCFDLKEAAQWRGLVDNFKFQELLNGSRRQVGQEKLQKRPSARRELEIHGHSFIHSPITKFGSPLPAVYTQHQSFQTPRIRSAYPIKSSNQPTRVRSAYPLSKSSALPGVSRMGARSGHVLNHRSQTLKNPDSFKMLEDTARLNSTVRTSSPTKSHIQFNKRIKLLPPSLPKFEESLPSSSSVLPPLNESTPPVRNKSRTKTGIPATSKIRSPNVQSTSTRMKPASAAQQRSKAIGHYRPFIMQPPSTFRATTNRQHDNIEVSIVGTSLNLFEPIPRPVRSVTIPKLRNI